MKQKSQNYPMSSVGKVPPQAIEIEDAVIGQLLYDNKAVHKVITRLSEDVFYKEENQVVYKAIQSLYDTNKPIDILTVSQQLIATGTLNKSGGMHRIAHLTERIISAENIEHHAAIIIEKFLLRELIKVSHEIQEEAFNDESDATDCINKADQEISKVLERSIGGSSIAHISVSSYKAVESAARRKLNRENGMPSGIKSGLMELDFITNGFQGGELIILAARPSMGKSSVMVKFAVTAAKQGIAACVYSLEMSDEKIADNIILSQCSVNKDEYKSGTFDNEAWNEILEAKELVDKLPIYVDPNPSVSMRYVKANSRVMQKKGQCGIIFIDYLQLTDMSTGERNRNREQEVAQASRQAKIIAKELNVPVILLSQMNRKAEDRADKKPNLSDLRESGAIEQDADLVMFLYRPEYYGYKEDANGKSTKGYGELIIAKHRNGATGSVPFSYNESMTHINNYEPDKKEDIPF